MGRGWDKTGGERVAVSFLSLLECEMGGGGGGWGSDRQRELLPLYSFQTCSEALREASLMAYCGKAINY